MSLISGSTFGSRFFSLSLPVTHIRTLSLPLHLSSRQSLLRQSDASWNSCACAAWLLSRWHQHNHRWLWKISVPCGRPCRDRRPFRSGCLCFVRHFLYRPAPSPCVLNTNVCVCVRVHEGGVCECECKSELVGWQSMTPSWSSSALARDFYF